MTAARFEPIAIQLGKLVALDRLLSPDAPRGSSAHHAAASSALPADLGAFMACHETVFGAAWQLLGAPQFERLSRLYARVEEELRPGGPPMSPIYDCYAAQHVLAEVPQGLADETPYSVLARLTSGDPRHERLHQLARALAGSHLDLYRVMRASGPDAELESIRNGSALSVRLARACLEPGDRMLARVLSFGDGRFIADAPYLLKASEAEWLDHLARATAAEPVVERPAAPRASQAKLSAKQQARLRQRQRAARAQAPDAAVIRHLQRGPSERYWLSYIMDGYAGERRGVVYLAGVPDRTETLPHHDDYRPGAIADPA